MSEVLGQYKAFTDIHAAYLRLNGVKAREHPVFKELTRVKQYFDKIKQAESPEAKKPQVSLDKDAAKRFIAASLSGNDQLDVSRATEQKEREARKIAEGSAAQNKDGGEGVQLPSRKRAADVSDSSSSSSSESEVEAPPPKKKKTNKKKVARNETTADVESTKKSERDKKKKKASSSKKSKKSAV